MRFYRVADNSFNSRGFPWIMSIKKGLNEVYCCKKCGTRLLYPGGDIQVVLEKNKGLKWPDVLGCGHYPLLIISSRVIEAFDKESLLNFTYYKVEIEKPFPKRLAGISSYSYYWIDGSKIVGALMDFKASGFVDVKFCTECGNRTDNISATYDRQHKPFSYVFKEYSWKKYNLFTTDISNTAFFCTDKIVQCAKKYKLINFQFIPIEEGNNLKGIKYL